MRHEEIAARTEAGIDARPQPLSRLPVEGQRLERHQAIDLGSPLHAHTAGLDPGRAGADAGAVVDADRAEAAIGKVKCNRQAGDSGTDDGDVGDGRSYAGGN